ncbi:hypothetical protein [Chromatium okenii]|jgi:hypothetical protein|uniref:hypothetical protein n=1 Tax=Chromatium okenii TaxID=61644 RepID=UPI00155896CB|nr:hypothetical protein [Chromatium okenii]
MATFTAYLLVGHGHPNDDGIIPIAELALSENSRPAWTLRPRHEAFQQPNSPIPKQRIWIPSHAEHILEDGLLMLALYVWRDNKLRHLARELFDLQEHHLNLSALDAKRIADLRQLARAEELPGKLALFVLRDSSLLNQLEKLEAWSIQAEVCTPRWWRIQNQWDATPRIGGNLAVNHNEC